MDRQRGLYSFISLPLNDSGPAYTCLRIAETMAGSNFNTHVFTPADRRRTLRSNVAVTTGIPNIAARMPIRIWRNYATYKAQERCLRRLQRDGRSIAYVWSDAPDGLINKLKKHSIIVREKFNCAKRVSGEIMQNAYKQIDAKYYFNNDRYNSRAFEIEQSEIEVVDYIFSPSPSVRDSLLTIGVPREKIIESSYGWEPQRFIEDQTRFPKSRGLNLLFVGYICVRKGAHILLEAWRRAGIEGRLTLVGAIEPLIRERYSEVLERDDVLHKGFTTNLGPYYRSADYFVFPSLEEGSPLVSYEAAGCGLPAIVSPMGAGALIRDGIEGYVIQSDAPDAWAEMFVRLSGKLETRMLQADAARKRAFDFTWDKVGIDRSQKLAAAIANAA